MTAWDEMVNGHGGVRPQWRPVLGIVHGLQQPGLAERARRLANAADASETGRSWRCDPIPLPLTAPEFALLEAGLCQRARLLEAILADVYGEQATLASGKLPPAAVFANPNFLRACRTGTPSAGPFLQAYAADLVRGPDGQWRVLADRTRGAFGVGYARECRRLLALTMPELFRSNEVRPLQPFFEAWQQALVRAAGPRGERPAMIAMLTEGAGDPHWPEHAALSRELGCALVEARDLMVQDGVLYLEGLSGLQRIDLLFRRMCANRLDPLQCPGAAPDGVIGLFEAARQGAVRILNHPGAALVEMPVLAAFMPALCRSLLGEPLLLATLPSMWMADEAAKRIVAAGFRRWAIRPAFDGAAPPLPLAGLEREQRAEIEEAIAASPWNYVGCTTVTPSAAPCHGQEGLVAQPIVLRLFLMHDGLAWRMLPGGIARVLPVGANVGEALPPDGLFKDVWVVTEPGGAAIAAKPAPRARIALRRSGPDIPSRVARDAFSLGRVVERLEGQARLCRAGLRRSTTGTALPHELAERTVLAACLSRAGIADTGSGTALEATIQDALAPGGGIAHGLDEAALLTSGLRDRFTDEGYAALMQAIRSVRREARAFSADRLLEAMSGLERVAITEAGIAADGLLHKGARLFLELGGRLERAAMTTTTLAAVLDQKLDRMESALGLALELCDCSLAYRNRYFAALQPAPVLDIILADLAVPSGLAHQYARAASLLHVAGHSGLAQRAQELQERAAALVDQVNLAYDPALVASFLPTLLLGIAASTSDLFDRIGRRFFPSMPAIRETGLEIA